MFDKAAWQQAAFFVSMRHSTAMLRALKVITIAATLAAIVIWLAFSAMTTPDERRIAVAATEVRMLRAAPAPLIRLMAAAPTPDERAVWNDLVAAADPRIAIAPMTAWPEAEQDAETLAGRIASEEPRAASAARDFVLRNTRPAAMPLHRRAAKDAPVLTMSRAGFSSDGTFAVVYVNFECPLCGYGAYVVLRRGEDGHWRSVAELVNWVS